MGEAADRCYHFKPIWQRAFITAAGPIANFILAIVIFSGIAMTFGSQPYQLPIVGSVVEGGAGEEAGFEVGDRITAINGNRIDTFQDIITEVVWRPGEELRFEIVRDDAAMVIMAAPRGQREEDRFGGTRTLGRIGLGSVEGSALQDRYNPIEAVGQGIDRTWSVVSMTARYVSRVVTGRASAELLNGPVGIVTAAGQTASTSIEAGDSAGESVFLLLVNLINLAAFLSVGLGLVNLLPIPILDGGHLVYYAYEAVARRPLSMQAQALGFRVGLVFVLGLMLVATWNDLNYLLGQIF
jgi:regulator of sigma E protease